MIMKNKLLPILALLCFACFGMAKAQSTLTVYDGDASSVYIPVYGFYADAYQKVEMIMHSDDLSVMTGGTIDNMTWFLSTPAEAAWGGNFKIYLKEVDATTPTSYDDLAGATLVYEGPLDGTGETLVIGFANGFPYGGNNLLIAVHRTQRGTYKAASFAGATVADAAIQGYSYASLDNVNLNHHDFLPKTEFEFIPSSGPVYYKPKNLAVSDITTTSATLTWEAGGSETTWNVEYKKKTEELWTSAGSVDQTTITLNALEAGVAYVVRVQGNYGNGNLSSWTTTSFVTTICDAEDMGEIHYTLTDTYGDGWNGNGKLQFVISGTDIVVEELTLPNATGNVFLEGTLMLCYDVDYDLVWTGGTYTYENGFVLTDEDNGVIYEFHGTGSSSDPSLTPGVLTTFQIHQPSCPRPKEVTASNVTYNGATISWTPGAVGQNQWEMIYGAGNFAPEAIDMIPFIVNENTYELTNLHENTTYSVYVRSWCGSDDQSDWCACTFITPLRFPIPSDLTIGDITSMSVKASWTGVAETYNIRYRTSTLKFWEDFDGLVSSDNPPEGWTMIDADGDGYCWYGWNPISSDVSFYDKHGNPTVFGNACITSASYNSISLTPDNWLITPQVELDDILSLWYRGQDPDWAAEHFAVYVSTAGNTATTDFVELVPETIAGTTYAELTVDLSSYQGQMGYIAIRHFNVSDMFCLNIDNVSISEKGEWITVNGVTSPYVITDLDPKTIYDVQVQGVYGDGLSDWSQQVSFTTYDHFNVDGDEYTIYSATGWDLFCDALQDNDTYNHFIGKTVKLCADISVTRMAGNDNSHTFGGTFDGQGHTLTMDYTTNEEITAPFRYVNGATIENLKTDGIINISNKFAGGVMGQSWGGTVSITNCVSDVTINSTVNGDGTHGGFIALNSYGDLSFTGCVFSGEILGTSTTHCSGFVGWTESNHDATVVFTDCFFKPTNLDVHTGYTFSRARNLNSVTVNNSYYTEPLGGAQGRLVLANPAVSPVGEATATYDVSGLTLYGNGIQFGEVFYYDTERNFLRTIAGYGTGSGGWRLIASPLVEAVTPTEAKGFHTNACDLYRFNQAMELEWENWKDDNYDNYHFDLESGKGYLYAGQAEATLVFTGTPYSGNGQVTLTKAADATLSGWNLIGNPFKETAYLADGRPFYVMNDEGSDIIAATGTAIGAMEGVFVIANTDGETVTFTTAPRVQAQASLTSTQTEESLGSLAIEISRADREGVPSGVIDRAIIRFDEGEALPKLQMNDNSTRISITQDGKDYAVINLGRDAKFCVSTTEIPISFKAAENGVYTLSISAPLTSNLSPLTFHLIDTLTGSDIDLLSTPTYTFEAKVTDDVNRFKLVFATKCIPARD